MSEESKRVLDLLASGKITVDEADRLLRAIGVATSESAEPKAAAPRAADPGRSRFVRIAVVKAAAGWKPEKLVNIRVPIALLRSGMRLGAIIPNFAGEDIARKLRERGIDIDLAKVDKTRIDELLNSLDELDIDIDSGNAKVRITRE